ncbi:MAG: PKD-like domain-containing protein, partial [bacterium]
LFNQSNVTQSAYYSVRVLSGNCVGAAFSLEVVLSPKPVITQMTTVTCSGVFFNITPVNGSNGIVPFGTKYRWSEPQVTATMTGGESKSGQDGIYGTLLNRTNTVQTATYIVTPSIGSCGDGAPFTVLVTVNPTPEIGVLSTVTCSGVPFQVSPVVSFGGRDIVTADTKYRWNVPTYSGTMTGGQSRLDAAGQTHIFGTLLNRTNIPQTATYTVIPRADLGGCEGTSFTVLVTVNPTPEIGVLSTVTCSGVPFQVSPVVSYGGRDIVTADTKYRWDVPTYSGTMTGGQSRLDAAGQTHIFGTLLNRTNIPQTATYTVIPRADLGGCAGTSFTVLVTVNPTPEIGVLSTVTCSGVPFQVS